MDKNLLLTLNSKKIGLDVKGGELNFISHAHTDHSYALKDKVPIFCNDITASLLNLDFSNNYGDSTIIKSSYSKKSPPIRIPIPQEMSLKNAGHILGSAQLVAQTKEFQTLVYTGDFKLRDGLTTKKGDLIQCDTLIMECTYGNPSVNFPNPNEVYAQMENWHRQNKSSIQLWGGYATGKAQELIKFLNDFTSQTPIVPPDVARISNKYIQNGIKLDFIPSDTEEAKEIMREEFTAVFPPNRLSKSFSWEIAKAHKKKTKVAIATGWTGIRNTTADISFPLSDHADFGELLLYAKESGAKKVYLAHGNNSACANALKNEGINAKEIDKIGQKEIRQLIL